MDSLDINHNRVIKYITHNMNGDLFDDFIGAEYMLTYIM